MKVYLAQVSPTVGDLRGNFSMMKQQIQFAVQTDADVVVFPELVTVGYPPKDLLYNNQIWESHDVLVKQMQTFINAIGKQVTVIFGGLHQVTQTYGRYSRYNAAFIVDPHYKTRIVHKRLLPCYDVFDESRHFASGINEPYLPVLIRINRGNESHDIKTDVIICEDMWNFGSIGNVSWMAPESYTHDPISHLKGDGPVFIINGSPFWRGKIKATSDLVKNISMHLKRPVVWVNQVGGQDDLVFGGYSMVAVPHCIKGYSNSSGIDFYMCEAFAQDYCLVRTEDISDPVIKFLRPGESCCDSGETALLQPKQPFNPRPTFKYNDKIVEESDFETWCLFSALKLGLYDYCCRNGFKEIVFGASGGIDSAVVGAIAALAVGGANVTAITMPSKFSSEGSVADAKSLAENFGMNFIQWPIGEIHTEFRNKMLSGGKQKFSSDVVDQNIQPRVRGTLLMGYSNDTGALLVSTGNRSEAACGFTTMYGDSCGGFALLLDVFKTQVYDLARFINKYNKGELLSGTIPVNSIDKPPSAELAEGQKDIDSLPPYDILDKVLEDIIEHEMPTSDLILKYKDPTLVNKVLNMYKKSEWKRQQSPISPKVSLRSFGSGRRMPISSKITLI